MPAAAPMPDASADLDGLRTQMAAVLADARTDLEAPRPALPQCAPGAATSYPCRRRSCDCLPMHPIPPLAPMSIHTSTRARGGGDTGHCGQHQRILRAAQRDGTRARRAACAAGRRCSAQRLRGRGRARGPALARGQAHTRPRAKRGAGAPRAAPPRPPLHIIVASPPPPPARPPRSDALPLATAQSRYVPVHFFKELVRLLSQLQAKPAGEDGEDGEPRGGQENDAASQPGACSARACAPAAADEAGTSPAAPREKAAEKGAEEAAASPPLALGLQRAQKRSRFHQLF